MPSWQELLETARARRDGLSGVTDAYRLVDDAADDCPGVVVDRYGDWDVLSVANDAAPDLPARIAGALVASGSRGVYLKRRPRADLRREDAAELAPKEPIAGSPAPEGFTVHEHALRFGVALGDGLSTGLFTDQRDNRRWVRDVAQGRRVLNLFSYTCTFTAAAALGGATETVSVDLSQRALDRGRENLERNALAGPAHRLFRGDAVRFLERAARKDPAFDLVVLDPPSFGTRDKGTFSVERDYPALLEHSLRSLAPNGLLLAVTNHRKTTLDSLLNQVHRAAAASGRRIVSALAPPSPVDHRYRAGGLPTTKSVRITLSA